MKQQIQGCLRCGDRYPVGDRCANCIRRASSDLAAIAAVIVHEDEPWKQQAACLGCDPDLFYPERGTDSRAARSICMSCPVRIECLEYALRNNEKFGLWGGKSVKERNAIRAQRAGLPSPGPNSEMAKVSHLHRQPAGDAA